MKYRVIEDTVGCFWPQCRVWGSWRSTEDRKSMPFVATSLEDAKKKIECHKLNRENGSIGYVPIKTIHKIV